MIVILHGAGVDVDGDQTRKAFEQWPDLPGWAVVPSGVTGWSGDDWRTEHAFQADKAELIRDRYLGSA